MAKFSLGEEEDDHGEGPSDFKRQKIWDNAKDLHRPEAGEEEEEEDGEVQVQEEEAATSARDEEGEDEDEGDELGASVGTGSVSVCLVDPYVFDCSICFEPLSSPVFQCENGHIACSLCCSRLGNKCPSCCLPIGYNRCRAIENVLDSIKLSCQNRRYGCKKTLKFSEKRDHEQTCMSAPCPCPFSGCHFLASSEELSQHVFDRHPSSMVTFLYNKLFRVSLNIIDRFIILRESEKGELFVLKNFAEILGNAVTVDRICANSSKGKLSYSLAVKNVDSSLGLYSSTENVTDQIDDGCSRAFLLVPKMFLGNNGQDLNLEVTIWDRNLGNGQSLR